MRKETDAPKRRRIWDWLLIGFVILCFGIACYPYFRAPVPLIFAEGTLELHFIDVGQGGAALLRCNGHDMLIDGGSSQSSSKVYTYLVKHNIKTLDYIVSTHPHDDHTGGLAGALNAAKAERALSSAAEAEGRVFQSFLKYLDQQGVTIEVPQPGDTFDLGTAHITVLGPIRDSVNLNDTSLVLRVSFGSFHALFTGDAEIAEEADILSSGAELQSDVLKVGHHGGSDASSEEWLNAVQPKTAVISCGKNNEYGHPSQLTLDRLKAVGAEILRTDERGNIVLVVQPDGSYSLANEMGIPEGKITFVVNTKSGKFHIPRCPSAADISDQNRLDFSGTREELIDLGYEPCGRCKP